MSPPCWLPSKLPVDALGHHGRHRAEASRRFAQLFLSRHIICVPCAVDAVYGQFCSRLAEPGQGVGRLVAPWLVLRWRSRSPSFFATSSGRFTAATVAAAVVHTSILACCCMAWGGMVWNEMGRIGMDAWCGTTRYGVNWNSAMSPESQRSRGRVRGRHRGKVFLFLKNEVHACTFGTYNSIW